MKKLIIIFILTAAPSKQTAPLIQAKQTWIIGGAKPIARDATPFQRLMEN